MKEELATCVPDAVRTHFEDVSSRWTGRYTSRPRGMADLDLILRRENAQRFLWTILRGSDRQLLVLDLGCGTGNGLDGIPRDRISVLGVDAVAEMIEIAARNHSEDRFLQAELETLPIEDNHADVVLCLGTLEYVSDPDLALSAIRRVLKPGGHLIVSFPNRDSLFRRISKIVSGVEDLAGTAVRSLQGRSRRRNPEARYKHAQWSPEAAVVLLERRGFLEADIVFNTFGLWGRLGRLRVGQRFSVWASDVFRDSSRIGGRFACTMVLCVQKPANP